MSPEDREHWKQGYGKGDWEGWREFSLQSSQTPTPSVQFNSSCNPRGSQAADKQPLKTQAGRSHGNLLPLAYPMGGPRSQDRTHLQCAGPRQSSPRVKPPLPMRKSSENTPVLVRAPAPRRTGGQNLSNVSFATPAHGLDGHGGQTGSLLLSKLRSSPRATQEPGGSSKPRAVLSPQGTSSFLSTPSIQQHERQGRLNRTNRRQHPSLLQRAGML